MWIQLSNAYLSAEFHGITLPKFSWKKLKHLLSLMVHLKMTKPKEIYECRIVGHAVRTKIPKKKCKMYGVNFD